MYMLLLCVNDTFNQTNLQVISEPQAPEGLGSCLLEHTDLQTN